MKGNFKEGIEVGWLADGKRLSMRHGPIDLIVEADGEPEQIEKAYRQATQAFESVLTDLVAELDILRRPLGSGISVLRGEISTRMHSAARRTAGQLFATPMIAVAGAVADHILRAMNSGTKLDRVYVNNGGDIALHLSSNAVFDIGICSNIETGKLMSRARIHADDNIGGIATSGWRGRSHSLGIADAVTVFAQDAATADAAATLIANAIDLPGHSGVTRLPACELAPDTDLGDQPVTVGVEVLTNDDLDRALSYGNALALTMINRGDILAVYASLQGWELSLSEENGYAEYQRIVGAEMPTKEISYA